MGQPPVLLGARLLVPAALLLSVGAVGLIRWDTRAPRRQIPSWAHPALAAAIIALTAATLLAMGRTPWCRCGSIKLWTGDAWGPENSQQFTDPYTFTHITHGVLLYFLLRIIGGRLSVRTRGVLTVAAESGWEIFENSDMVIRRYRAATMALGYYGDSVLNSVGDILAGALGFLLASRLPSRVTIILVVTMELTLLLWIHDSLLLNILMLAYPIKAIKTWQLRH